MNKLSGTEEVVINSPSPIGAIARDGTVHNVQRATIINSTGPLLGIILVEQGMRDRYGAAQIKNSTPRSLTRAIISTVLAETTTFDGDGGSESNLRYSK